MKVYACYTSDNEALAITAIKAEFEAKDITVTSIKTISSQRACRNAYGKEMPESEFESMDPDSDEAWFNDYDFCFEVHVKIENGVQVSHIFNAINCVTGYEFDWQDIEELHSMKNEEVADELERIKHDLMPQSYTIHGFEKDSYSGAHYMASRMHVAINKAIMMLREKQ